MEPLVTETSKWPVSSRKPKGPHVVAVKVLHGKKYLNLHKGETKPQALEIITYFQFFICNKKDFLSSPLDLTEEKRKTKIKIIFFIFLSFWLLLVLLLLSFILFIIVLLLKQRLRPEIV